jgi:two-component system LytT family response regulator
LKTRVLIVDDEPLARERLRRLVESDPELEVIGECGDGASALETIRSGSPDLVLLDVQMPELDGFQVLKKIERDKLPAIIFVTAYDQFALKAFEVHAVDYLLKPINPERLKQALRRALDQLQQRQATDLSRKISALLADVGVSARSLERLAVKSSGKVIFVKAQDIDWVEAADNYVNLHVGNEAFLHRETMSSLESMLPADRFMRISRSTIVNVDRVKELQPLFHGEYAVILRNGTRLTLSRTHRHKLAQLMGKET